MSTRQRATRKPIAKKGKRAAALTVSEPKRKDQPAHVMTYGRPMPQRVHELWKRLRSEKRPCECPELGPRSFLVWSDADHEFHFACDPDAPLKHLGPLVVRQDGTTMFWALLKTKHPEKAKVLQIGWPRRSTGFMYRKTDEADGWQVAPVVYIAQYTWMPYI